MSAVVRVRSVSLEERNQIKRARDKVARARLPRDAMGRPIVTRYRASR